MPTEDVYTSGHLVLFHFGLAYVLMLRPVPPEPVMYPDCKFSFVNRVTWVEDKCSNE